MDNLKNKVAGIAVAVTLSAGGAVVIDQTQAAIPIECDAQKPALVNIDEKLRTYKVDEGFLQTRDMTTVDRAAIKGCEIAKFKEIKREKVTYNNVTYDIEVIGMELIDDGVAVYAKAWTSDGKQLGFGSDGTVEIERFVIHNPPVLVPDEKGTVVRTSWDSDIGTTTRYFREDPRTALLESLAHTISIKQQKFTDTHIEIGKIGKTTGTYYPDASPETTSVDGRCFKENSTSWATTRDATDCVTANDTEDYISIGSAKETNYRLRRGFALFDTSSLPDGASISSATLSITDLSVYGTGPNAESSPLYLVASTPASNTAIVVGDFDQVGATSFGSLTDSGLQDSYQNLTINATGISAISTTGVTKYGLRANKDFTNTTPTLGLEAWQIASADRTGTSQDIKLTIEYTAGAVSSGPVPGANDVIWFQ